MRAWLEAARKFKKARKSIAEKIDSVCEQIIWFWFSFTFFILLIFGPFAVLAIIALAIYKLAGGAW